MIRFAFQRTGSFLCASDTVFKSKQPCAKSRQVTLRSLTALTEWLRHMGIRWAAAQTRLRDRSLPPPVAETGRRSVGNRKECRSRHDYASFPGGPQTPFFASRLLLVSIRKEYQAEKRSRLPLRQLLSLFIPSGNPLFRACTAGRQSRPGAPRPHRHSRRPCRPSSSSSASGAWA